MTIVGRWKRLDQPAGDDPDHAGMPAFLAQDDRPSLLQAALLGDHLVGLVDDLLLDLLALGVAEVEGLGQLRGPGFIVGREHLDRLHRAFEPAGGVDPGGELEADRPGVHLAMAHATGDREQGAEPQVRRVGEAGQAVSDEESVLAVDRHDVGDGRHRHQADRLDEEVAEVGRRLLAVAEPLADLPGQLERHAAAAKLAERIGAPGQPRVDQDVGLGEVQAEGVVVGHDQLDAQLAGELRLA